MPVDYAIVIPAFNEEAYLSATIHSARQAMAALPNHSGRLVVVDNNSTDRTSEVAREQGADLVAFESVNQISRTRNTGARAATDAFDGLRFLVFLDADTQLPPDLLRQAIELLESQTVCAGGAVTEADGPLPFYVEWLLAFWNWWAGTLGLAAGSFVFCLREGFEAVGGFDEKVFAGEEVWLSKNLKRWGKKHGLKFRVLTNPPIVTSGRKGEWFSAWDFAGQLLVLFLFPWAQRSRKLCRMWYRRPESSS